jgi:hypothetical protein
MADPYLRGFAGRFLFLSSVDCANSAFRFRKPGFEIEKNGRAARPKGYSVRRSQALTHLGGRI